MAILKIILIVVFLLAALAVTIIVLCQEGKSAGLGSLSGKVSVGDSYWDKNKKYSLEGKLEKWTKITAIVFVLAALIIMLIPNEDSSKLINSNPVTQDSTQNAVNVEGGEGANVTTESAAPEAGDTATDNAAADTSAAN